MAECAKALLIWHVWVCWWHDFRVLARARLSDFNLKSRILLDVEHVKAHSSNLNTVYGLSSVEFAPYSRFHLLGPAHSLPESSLELYKTFTIAATEIAAHKHFAQT